VTTRSAATSEEAVLALARKRPLLRARDLVEQALPTIALTRLVAAGRLERVVRGVYSLPGRRLSENRSLAEASLLVPQGVICLLSALRLHGIGTQAPFEVWIAIPQNAPTPRVHQPSLRIVRMSGPALAEGVETRRMDGAEVQIFSAEKTVADCFKFRNRIGLDVALEALRDGWSRGLLSMDALARHAATDRVANVMRPYLESVAE
jgi:predicted transcriptional regulator of viral defense system